MGNQAASLPDLFSRGHYDEVIRRYNSGLNTVSPEDLPPVIGALSFLGRLFEAKELYRSKSKFFSPASKAAAVFYIGIGLVRKARFQQARKLFKLNQTRYGENVDPEVSFYVSQGIAFYLYYTGQFHRSESYAKKAFQAAIQSNSLNHKIVAQDLLAHALVQTGQIHTGLELLKQTRDLALNKEHKAFAEMLKVSILLYESEFGHRPETILNELNQCLQTLEAQDNYSRSNIVLETARQRILRGQWRQAEDLLNAQAPTIYGNENRRQEVRLNILWAKIAFLRGQSVLSWQYLRSAQLRLHPLGDRHLAVEILTAEIDILEEQNSPLATEKKVQLLKLSSSFASGISRNVLARRSWIEDLSPQDTGDALHDLLIEVRPDSPKAIKIVSESGYYSWYFKCLDLRRGSSYLVLGAIEGSLLIVSPDGIESHKLAETSRKILEVLQKGAVSKEQLVENVWGYTYDPQRHDNLVYSAMSGLRKTLGDKHLWIQTSEHGYYVPSDVSIFHVVTKVTDRPGSTTIPTVIKTNIDDLSLNVRQLQVLEYLKEKTFINTREYKELFQTTEITASRDLASLYKSGHVIRVGHGRSTHYMLSKEKKP